MGYYNYITYVVCLFSAIVGSLYHRLLNQNVLNKLLFNIFFSFSVFIFLMRIIPQCIPIFLKAKHGGIDLGKIDKKIIPESFGIVCGAFYLVLLFFNIPINYMQIQFNSFEINLFTHFKLYYPYLKDTGFDQNELNIMLAALLAICCMLMLGFVDDILNLKWRQKLIFPFVASLPILMVYFIDYNVTHVMLPKPFHFTIDLGIFYYVFMVMVVIFCTNSINILAGVNGLESGQSVIIALTIIIFNIIELNGILWKSHFISFVLMMPFLAVSLALFYYNWYPADVFVGDTYCYFAGMTFAVVGILGHFSKTMMLFFLPQIFNFIFSVPQLFHLVPCPRHRLPQYDSISDVMHCSHFKYRKSELKVWSKTIIWILKKLTFISEEKVSLSVDTYQVSNFTLINLILNWYGPLKESSLTAILLLIQIASSLFAFFIRYYLSNLVY